MALRSSGTIRRVRSALIRLCAWRGIKHMPNSYTYTDIDYLYTDPQTAVLHNIRYIADNEVLLFVEVGATARRSQELWANPVTFSGTETLFQIHHCLFQDIYEWAKKRTVEISKNGKQFFHSICLLIHFYILIA